ncbi:MAG TPA: aminoglycoside phosphotransferase [Gammaproteobacteria bacterium]|nr:aminoglycoside phosphotransferase [Gammaproteobacteria bacterium]
MSDHDERMEELRAWLAACLGSESFSLAPASADASFRRYFRVRDGDRTHIVMDAPPDKEDCRPFIAVARAFGDAGLNVPEILASDVARGFLLLSDFGDRQYLQVLDEANVDALYGDAMRALRLLQGAGLRGETDLPPYDEALLLKEMDLFRDWYVEGYLGVSLDGGQAQLLEQIFSMLAASALEQPRVWVHRDYHSRNLMVVKERNPGILDFQDAVHGPVCYDLVSLLRDCYIAWPAAQVDAWVADYFARAQTQGLLSGVDLAQFRRWFDWMGMQRHFKAVGIFARLYLRDGKPGYLGDIPRTMNYVLESAARYEEFRDLQDFLMGLPRCP